MAIALTIPNAHSGRYQNQDLPEYEYKDIAW